jgi:oligo-1,6-glucosidase/alpha-glucosidase
MTKIAGDERIAALLAFFQFTTRGVPVTYYGEEIGMSEGEHPTTSPQDPIGRRYKIIPKFILSWLNIYTNRDGCRTPMQWDNSENAGFCKESADPWLPVNQDYFKINVMSENKNAYSLLNIYRNLLKTRQENKALHAGSLQLVDIPGDEDSQLLLAYERKFDQEALLMLINFGSTEMIVLHARKFKEVVFHIGEYRRSARGELIINPLSGVILSP